MEAALLREPLEIRQLACIHPALRNRRIHAVKSEHYGTAWQAFVVDRPLVSRVRGVSNDAKAETRAYGQAIYRPGGLIEWIWGEVSDSAQPQGYI
jgi:hypothetical protein